MSWWRSSRRCSGTRSGQQQPAPVPAHGLPEAVDPARAVAQQRRRARRQPHPRAAADPLAVQPAVAGAAHDGLARGAGREAEQAERADQRLLPGAVGARQQVLAEDREQGRAGGGSAHGAASQDVFHREDGSRKSPATVWRLAPINPGCGACRPRQPPRQQFDPAAISCSDALVCCGGVLPDAADQRVVTMKQVQSGRRSASRRVIRPVNQPDARERLIRPVMSYTTVALSTARVSSTGRSKRPRRISKAVITMFGTSQGCPGSQAVVDTVVGIACRPRPAA